MAEMSPAWWGISIAEIACIGMAGHFFLAETPAQKSNSCLMPGVRGLGFTLTGESPAQFVKNSTSEKLAEN